MRAEQLTNGTPVGAYRVVGKTLGWRNRQEIVTVTLTTDQPGLPPRKTMTFNRGQHVPGSPARLGRNVGLPAAVIRRAHPGRNFVDRYENAEQRRERRNALRLALAAA